MDKNRGPDKGLPNGPKTFQIKPMGDRVAIVMDTPDYTYIYELGLEQAHLLQTQLALAIKQATAVHQA